MIENMRKKMHVLLLSLTILTTEVVLGNGRNKTNPTNAAHKTDANTETLNKNERLKRSLLDEADHPFWPHRGKKESSDYSDPTGDEPFWGTRGRRESGSVENLIDSVYPFKICNSCYSGEADVIYGNMKHTRDDTKSPFWGTRGRRSSEEVDDDGELFWGSRGRRQENEPFWGNRGRRHGDSPFWGMHRGKGRREDEPFWGNRGRREDEPFWGNRGRRNEEPFWGTRGRRDNVEPFWGNRGRREESEPFWGNRGRRENNEPFWGNRGRRKDAEPFWGSRSRRKQDLKESIVAAINDVQDDIENLSRLRRSNGQNSFMNSPSSNSKFKNYISAGGRNQLPTYTADLKSDPGTVLDNRMYAEQPHYIIVERNSRSSGEDDPFYITRGKKFFLDYNFEKAARDRRGAIEEIVKSVRNDPFYIARGKKDSDDLKIKKSTLSHDEFNKARELICATVDLIIDKNEKSKTKRDLSDSERDRRTTLKKLAAQLQMDPYFVSRGKRSENDVDLEDFINDMAGKCS